MSGLGNIQYTEPSNGSGSGAVTAAQNGLSIDPSIVSPVTVVLGNDLGGTSAQLLSDREIPLNNHGLIFSGLANPSGSGVVIFQSFDDTPFLPQIYFIGIAFSQAELRVNDDGAGNGGIFFGRDAGAGITTNTSRSIGIGQFTLVDLTSGTENVAIGSQAMQTETTGSQNTAVGVDSLQQMTGGQYNTALGWQAGQNLQGGINNTVLGAFTSGQYFNSSQNICIGGAAGTPYLAAAFIANKNIIIGTFAQSANSQYGDDNVIIGDSINNDTGGNTITNNNILIGANIAASSVIGLAGGVLNNTTMIGQGMTTTRSNVARIGRADQNLQLGWTADQADSGARVQINGTLQTSAPVTTAAKVRFGTEVAAAITANLTRYLEIEYNGTVYKLVTANP